MKRKRDGTDSCVLASNSLQNARMHHRRGRTRHSHAIKGGIKDVVGVVVIIAVCITVPSTCNSERKGGTNEERARGEPVVKK